MSWRLTELGGRQTFSDRHYRFNYE